MPEPKARSATWLSSTYAVDDESEEAKYCSGGYQVMRQAVSGDDGTRQIESGTKHACALISLNIALLFSCPG